MEELKERIDTVLTRCRKSRITISRKKLQVGRSIHFAGHIIADTGIRPDEAKYQAIEKFPRPEDTKDLRSFNGLATQLGNFIPDLSFTHAIQAEAIAKERRRRDMDRGP